MDINATIKPPYERQASAGRLSHVLHTFWVGNLRLALDVQVSSGKQKTSVHTKAALGLLLDELGDKRPTLVMGDSAYGNEGICWSWEAAINPTNCAWRRRPMCGAWWPSSSRAKTGLAPTTRAAR